MKAVEYIREKGEISNSAYQKTNNIGRTTATEELKWLVDHGIIVQFGKVGRGTKYKLK